MACSINFESGSHFEFYQMSLNHFLKFWSSTAFVQNLVLVQAFGHFLQK